LLTIQVRYVLMEEDMKLTIISVNLSLALLSLIAGPNAIANDTGWYTGANFGQARAQIDDEQISRNMLMGSNFTSLTISTDQRDIGYKLFGGYQFNKYISLEGGYFELGKFGYTVTTTPAGTLDGTIKLRGLNLDLVGTLPITKKFSAFGRFGVNYAEARDTFTGTGAVGALNFNPSQRDTNYKYGLGIEYALTDSLDIRAEAERYRVNDAVNNKGDIDLFSVGLVYRFGGNKKPYTSSYSAEEIAPPVQVIVPVQNKTEQYCSILNIQFDINNDNMQLEDKEKLAVVGTYMNKYPATTAVFEGYTDKVGTTEENMKLSQRRAQSVVSYLEDTHHIAASRLTAVGHGETHATATNATMVGKRMNRRIDAVITCVNDIPGLTVEPARLTIALVIEYDKNKANLKPQYEGGLSKVADFMKVHPSVTATVEGHTGNLQASPALAMQISRQRAQNVVNYLINNGGISSSRLSSEGFGQTRRVAYSTSLEGQQENRRVNIIFNYAK
jgi:OOP family OmpA-OmpF porin